MSVNRKRIFKFAAKILSFVIIEVILSPFFIGPRNPNESLIDYYKTCFQNPPLLFENAITCFIYTLGLLVALLIIVLINDHFLNKSHVNFDCEYACAFISTIGVFSILFIVDFVIGICSGDIQQALFSAIFFIFSSWCYFSLLYSSRGIAIARAYLISMILFLIYVQLVNIPKISFSTLLIEHTTTLILMSLLLSLIIKGLIITFNSDFIKAFPPQKDIRYTQIVAVIFIMTMLIILRSIEIDFSSVSNTMPPLNPAK